MTKHKLVFTSRRSTPKVLSVGKAYTPKKGYGKVVSTRRATPAEERVIASGKWLRVDSKGRTPGASGYSVSRLNPGKRGRRA